MLQTVHSNAKVKTKNLEDFIDMPIVVRVNKFDEAAAKEFNEQMGKAHSNNQEIIPIVIDSYGGQVYSLLSMVDIIKNSSKPIATIVEGKAMSCGAVLFTCGNENMRYMSPNSTLMIHDVSSMEFGKAEEIKAGAEEVERLNQKIYGLMSKNIGKPDKYLWNIVHGKGRADWFLDPKEAKKHNIANHIKTPQIKLNLNISMSFE